MVRTSLATSVRETISGMNVRDTVLPPCGLARSDQRLSRLPVMVWPA
jgi:hypothetical protein